MNRIESSIIIVTYQSAPCIRDCLESVRMQEGVTTRIVVVDNASADGTAQVVRGFDSEIHLIENHENLGFGKACNQGFEASHGRFIYLLNPDAQLVGANALAV